MSDTLFNCGVYLYLRPSTALESLPLRDFASFMGKRSIPPPGLAVKWGLEGTPLFRMLSALHGYVKHSLKDAAYAWTEQAEKVFRTDRLPTVVETLRHTEMRGRKREDGKTRGWVLERRSSPDQEKERVVRYLKEEEGYYFDGKP